MFQSFLNFLGLRTPASHPATFFKERFEGVNVALKMHFFTRGRVGGYNIFARASSFSSGGMLSVANPNPLGELRRKLNTHPQTEGGISNSVMVDYTEEMFIPVVDFVGRPSEFEFTAWWAFMTMNYPFLKGLTLEVFDSGNSFHGYVFHLLSPSENDKWINALHGADHVDAKWLKNSHTIRWTGGVLPGQIQPTHAFSIKL